jgi:predicted permease
MRKLRVLWSRLGGVFRGQRSDDEFAAELESHLQMHIDDNLRAGMSPEQARRHALIALGGMEQTKQAYRERRTLLSLEALVRDLHYGWRQLWKSPPFTLTAVLTLAIGIGGMTAASSVVEAVLLRPLPFQDPDRLISIHEHLARDSHELHVSAPDVLIFQRENQAFSGSAGFVGTGFELTGAGAPFRASAERVSVSLFSVLGIEPLLGRTFTQQEDENAASVTVISFALWKERFQSDPNVLGKTIDLDRRPYTIIGVMPQHFAFPIDAGRLSHQDLWVPMSFTPVEKNSEGDNFDYSLVARLKPGLNHEQAQADIDRVIAGIQTSYPANANVQLQGYFRTLKEEAVRNVRPLLNMLLAAVGLVLLIACVNLANLLLVRAAGRQREFGVRLALGAARRVLLRQLLTESLLLSVLGGLAGIALAVFLVRTAALSLPDSLPRLNEIAVRWPMFAVALGLVALTGTLCGLAPALACMKTDVLDSLRDGSQSSGQGRSQHRLCSLLVTVEVALATLLLVASGLLLRSFARMLATNPGFQPQRVLTAPLSLPVHDYPTQQKVADFYQALQQKLELLPAVKAVGFSSNIPIVGQNSGRLIAPEGYVPLPGEGMLIASNYLVQGDYFQALHIPLIRGRYFNVRDEQDGAPLVAIVSQSFAEQYFHGRDPIGLHVKVGPRFDTGMPAITVVGVVGDIKQGALDQPTIVQMYEPISQAAADLGSLSAMIGVVGSMDVVIRTDGDPTALSATLEKIIHQLDPSLAVSHVRTMDEIVAATASSRRFNTVIVSAFAVIALMLSLLGIYGVLAYSVSERTREIAVRMALGATRNVVLLRTLHYAVTLAAIGITAGLIASLGLTHFLSSLLYDVKPLDAAAILGAVLVLLACAALAGWLPAHRAASIDPMQALRTE